ncbi:MAG: dimethyl sulfoxide reductase anchor subunit [Gammaproteobacteria bacterium]|nr:dimethyl sulfoxide reductase anchor subunit [Gammaproteobacteria bacterium]
MHPSREIIFFTTASGAGYGILAILGIFGLFNQLPGDRAFGFCALLLAFLLITAGLAASTRHLGHPERMMLALTQWRSSWLSREGVLALFTYGPAALFALGWVGFGHNQGVWADMGALAALAAVATVFCTAMIYGSLRAIPRWHSVWVPINYLALSAMTGAVLLNFIASGFHVAQSEIARIAMVSIVVALICKVIYWAVTDAKQVSTIETATRLGGIGRVTSLDSPHSTPNYLQKEMGFRTSPGVSLGLRGFVLLWGFAVPFFLVLIGRDTGSDAWALGCAFIAAISAAAGVVAERWLFFAEAKHQSSMYYGERAV